MDRRTFLKSMVAAGVGHLFIDLDLWASALAAPLESVVAVAENPVPGEAARRAVELLGGFGRFVPRGSSVVVKPNIGWDRTPEQGANTHPDIVKAVVAGCLAAGASRVKVFDRACNDERLTYRSSGIMAAVESLDDKRAEIFIPDDRKYVATDIKSGRELTRWAFHEDALGADVFINVPILKHHGLCRITMGMKNLMGVMGGNRGKIHNGFAHKIVDVNSVITSHLTILDATRILMRHGPQGGNVSDVRVADTVIAGTDIVAVDAWGAKLFGDDPRNLDYLVNAAERGLGVVDLARVKVLRG